VFRDEETLSRIGRLCKDLGDRAIEEDPVPISQLAGHPARQWYESALQRYRDAFALNAYYYPGVNAATLALLTGDKRGSRDLARRVLKACRKINLSAMHVEDCFWILATRGEAALLIGRGTDAAEIYREALGLLRPQHLGMAQSAYNQLCRLHWALGKTTDAAFAVFKKSPFRLAPGPLLS
jgi:tetratricopeptide (TPR) repeat protein